MSNEILKRGFDIVVSASALVILSPLIIVVAVAVTTTSPGGVLFRQTRVGRHSAPFTIFKFRSMSVPTTGRSTEFTPGQTSRITTIGRILRKTKIDELPQLWNVFVGDMSIVGPRPEVPAWTKVYPVRWEIVLSVRPGITDSASIVFRDEEEILAAAADPEACYRKEILPRKLDLATQYATHHTFAGDIMIILRTLLAVFGRGSSPPSTSEPD